MSTTFESLALTPELLGQLQARNINTPSPVQAEAIPAALAGRDILAQSQTGTGKTLAYLLPLIMRIDATQRSTQAVVVAPTQELAMQIVREAEYYTNGSELSVASLIGGAALQRQVDKLKLKPQLIVGTPGRISELLQMRKLKMHEVRHIVIDEVDHVLKQGGSRDTEKIIQGALRDRQLLFFSATLPAEVKDLAARWMSDPTHIGIDPDKRIAETIEHLVFECEERDKLDTLRRLVRHWKPKQAIVFVNETHMIGEWESKLVHLGLSVGALYGDAPKQERVNMLRRFREGEFQLLLATDVAARGLDIPELPYVFSVQPALNADHYVHRAGRTGRMGRKGTSVNIIHNRERFIIRKFERELDIKMLERAFYDGRVIYLDENNMSKPTRPHSPARSKRPQVRSVQKETPVANKQDRQRDRKNKGAPKWLKDKREK
ncbi:DEAD/DEAH box helicase [Paenibacillus sp. 481]|uniref:DEAD/DEAH box helicase n=1 Tax=Paenibacillus sp. 481 TaxID=2835869 RepID=UPI001E54AC03|nr:DEAD/DEAH box helicase [Paenibacillus sp. 481]UHA74546.1 DEAD/DEAH box helicase [Paenibacillus sp. 481]